MNGGADDLVAMLDAITTARHEAIDITDRVADAVRAWPDGIALVSTEHTTAALVLGPNDDGMLKDFVRVARAWLDGLGPFEHVENDNPNGEAHILSSFAGTRLLVERDAGRLCLGRWQRILLLEFDGPLARRVRVRSWR